MADRILGMGDVLSLIEQAERTMDKDVTTKGAAAMIEGRFTLEDFLEQLQQVKKMGSVSGMLSMLPGVPKDLKQASSAIDDRQIGQIEAIIRSMTPGERAEPSVIDGARRVRIANGSGTATSDVNALLKQFKEMQKMMKGFGKGGMGGALGGLGGMFGKGPKLSPSAMAEMAELDAGGGFPGLPGMGAAPGAPGDGTLSGAGVGGSSRGSSKARGKGGKKGKGGGRVTPKAR
jgi:signal recognition particle subunit SRP54